MLARCPQERITAVAMAVADLHAALEASATHSRIKSMYRIFLYRTMYSFLQKRLAHPARWPRLFAVGVSRILPLAFSII